jgi:hypothetical protein
MLSKFSHKNKDNPDIQMRPNWGKNCQINEGRLSLGSSRWVFSHKRDLTRGAVISPLVFALFRPKFWFDETSA